MHDQFTPRRRYRDSLLATHQPFQSAQHNQVELSDQAKFNRSCCGLLVRAACFASSFLLEKEAFSSPTYLS